MPETSSISPDDVVIAVIGPTGAGKSHFVNAATGDESIKIGHSLASETSEISAHRTWIDDRRVVLLDTPGFDDTYRSDADVLLQLARWLGETYSQGKLLSGIIYMYPITYTRMTGSSLRSLKMFQKLIGDTSVVNLACVTTMWGHVEESLGARREKELIQSEESMGYWVRKGACVYRYDGSEAGSKAILKNLLQQSNQKFSLSIQRELVDQRLSLSKTEAGKVVHEQLLKIEAMHAKEMADLRQQLSEALSKSDTQLAETLRIHEASSVQQRQHAQSQVETLRSQDSVIEALQRRHEEAMNSLRDRVEFLERQVADPPPPYAMLGVQTDGQTMHCPPGQARAPVRICTPFSALRSIIVFTWMFVFSGLGFFRRLLRPRVRDGYRRLEWKCSCGEFLFADLKEGSPESLDELATRLAQQSDGTSIDNSFQPPNSTLSTTTSSGKGHSRHPSRPVGWSNAGGGGGGSNVPDPTNQPSSTHLTNDPSQNRVRESLELCLESSKYARVLAEAVIEGSPSDGELFQKIRDKYEAMRQSILPSWMRLKRPDKAVFVKFRLGRRPLVSKMAGSPEFPSIPPKIEVDAQRYKYAPCPIDEPPMDSNTFMHHFYKPAWQHPDVLWSPRLPKKLGESLAHAAQPLEHGWGIELIEAPNWALFTILMLISLILSGVVAGIYSWKNQDSQTGVAIGAWLTAVQAMGITVVALWWA